MVKSVYALSMQDHNNKDDTISITLRYENGSTGNINYFSNGDKALQKEYLEIFSNGWAACINDFRELNIYQNGRIKRIKALAQKKGQKEEIDKFIHSVIKLENDSNELRELINTSKTTFGIIESLRTGDVCEIDKL